MTEKASIKENYLKYYKKVVFVPAILLLPTAIFYPSTQIVTTLFMLAILHFVCFMAPLYYIRYIFVKLYPISEKTLNKIALINMLASTGLLCSKIYNFINYNNDIIYNIHNNSYKLLIFPVTGMITILKPLIFVSLIYVTFNFIRNKIK